MPLNYSKWDRLELSDDSDIEGHPNVDKKSLIRWKQRDIHEKREMRKLKIVELRGEITTTDILLPRIRALINDIHKTGPQVFSELMERLKAAPSPDGPEPGPPGAPKAPSYDEMILQLQYKVWDDVRGDVDVKDKDNLGKRLEKELEVHYKNLEERLAQCHKDLEEQEKEAKAKITSEDIHESWESKYVPPPKPAEPEKPAPKKAKGKQKQKETTVEVLNAPKTLERHAESPALQEASGYEEDVEDADDADDDDDDEEDDLPTITPSLLAFSRIPYRAYEESYTFLQHDQSILAPDSMDSLLVEGFKAELKGDKKYAKGCVHQGLLLQYCEKLGRDGVRQFFKSMTSGNPNAQRMFLKDVEDTYALMSQRAANTKASGEEEGREQIQLQVEDPSTVIQFNIPDQPPPDQLKDLTVEGEGADELDPAEVWDWLKNRWAIWQGFPKKLRKALKTKELDEVNKVLGAMSVEEAEKVVGQMSAAGILAFSQEGIRDETPAGKAAAAAAAEDTSAYRADDEATDVPEEPKHSLPVEAEAH